MKPRRIILVRHGQSEGNADQAKLVKLADKISNLRDILASTPSGWALERQQAYFDWAARVVNGLRGVHPELEALFDQIYSKKP